MAKKMKKLLALFLAVMMVVSTMSVGAFAAEPEPSCGKEVHQHTEGCYAQVLKCELVKELTCDKGEHQHGEDCYHVHSEACYTLTCTQSTERELTCNDAHHKAECLHMCDLTCVSAFCELSGTYVCDAEHDEHTDECPKHECTLSCVSARCEETGKVVCEEEHEHTDSCPKHECTLDCVSVLCELSGTYVCGYEQHEHEDDCYTTHTHTFSECYNTETETCGKEAGVTVDCTTEVHAHGDDCYTAHEHGEDCYENKLVCPLGEHTHDETCVAQPQLLMTLALGEDYVAQIGEVGYETLEEAVAAANAAEDGATITLLANVELGEKLTIKKNITIEGAHTINRTTAGTLFAVVTGATLTLDGGVTIDGGNNWIFDSEGYYADMEACVFDGPSSDSTRTYSTSNGVEATTYMFTISGTNSTVVMNKATIQNNWGAPLFYISDSATLITNEGSLIRHIRGRLAGTTSGGGGMYSGTWTMNGGKIDGVHGHNTNGGLVSIRDNSVVNINGGVITNVTTLGLNANGNGILFEVYDEKSKLNINGGDIYGNASFSPGNGWGSVVYLNRGGDFTMTGGTIRNNKSDICTAFVSNDFTSIELLGGTIVVDRDTHPTRFESLFCGNTVISKDMNIIGEDGARFLMLGDATNTLKIDGQISGDGTMWLMHSEPVTGEGTITSDVLIKTHKYYSAADVTLASADWKCLITVDSVGSDATLTVQPGANVTDGLVRVLGSVPNADYLNKEESAAEQAAAYVQEDGANVTSPVLYYHRLTSDQKSDIVVTFDYNGGLDAQGWSGCQLTGAEAFAPACPAPTRENYVLAGWKYAVDNDPESLSMAGTADYAGETIAQSVRLIAQWKPITYTVTYQYEGAVPAGAPAVPAAMEYAVGANVAGAAVPSMDGFIFRGWNDPCASLVNGKMPAHDVTLTGYWLPANKNVDPPIGIKTDKETDSKTYEVKIEVPGDGEVVHDEVILIIDGSYSGDEEWGDMAANIVQIGEAVLNEKNQGRTQITVISFGNDDNVVVEGIKTVDELKAMLPEQPGGLLYGRSGTNCEVGLVGAMEYIQKKAAVLNDVNVIFISDGGTNTDETPRAFDTNWRTYSTRFGALTVAQATLEGALIYGENLPSAAAQIFGNDVTKDDLINNWSEIKEDQFYAFCDAVWADVYAYAGLTAGNEYPISVVEYAFVKYDEDHGTHVQEAIYYSMYQSSVITYPDIDARTIAAAEKLTASDIVDKLYLVQYANKKTGKYDSRGAWMDAVSGGTYIQSGKVSEMIDNLGSMLNQLSMTNYTNVVVTDYMSKWVNLDVNSIKIVNDTTGETIWTYTGGWVEGAEKPTAAEPPVTVTLVDAADYADGGNDVVGNTSGEIYKLTWYVKDDALLRTDTYSLCYTVTVDTAEEGFIPGTEFPANGNTFVEYKDENGKDKNNDIDVPNVTIPAYKVTYVNGSVVLQATGSLMTGDDIPNCNAPTDYVLGSYYYEFMGWHLTSGTEGENDTVGTTDLVYEAVFNREYIGDSYTDPTEEVFEDEKVPLAGIPAAFREDHIAYIIGRDDGLVHPEASITRAEVATIFFRLLNDETREQYMTSVNYFTDVNEGDWYNNAISTLNAMGIIYGRSAEIFDPNANITRAEFAAIAARFDPTASTEGGFFTDIDGHWAELEINMAANNGWVEGYEGLFRPDDEITRAEAMTMINRVLHRIPETEDDLLDYMIIWPDNMDTEQWYYLAVQEATNSHDYGRKENEYEFWTALQAVPDWAALEY